MIGVVGSIVLGAFLDRFKGYRRLNIALSMTVFITALSSVFVFPSGYFPLVLIVMVIAGGSMIPILTVGLSFGD